MDSVLLVCASNSVSSINRKVMNFFSERNNLERIYLSEFEGIPILNKDHFDSFGVPKSIEKIYSILRKYDRLVFFAPENNGYLSSFFKNILDWLSLMEVEFLRDKKVFVVSVSTTARKVRNMEEAVSKIFNVFGSKKFVFVNFNEYDENNLEERTNLLLSGILDKNL